MLAEGLQLAATGHALSRGADVDRPLALPTGRPLVDGLGVPRPLDGLTGLREFGRRSAP
jgi:hypothetical protein